MMTRKKKYFWVACLIGVIIAALPTLTNIFFLSPLGQLLDTFVLSVIVLLPFFNLFSSGTSVVVAVVVVNGIIYGLLGLLLEKFSRKK
ncbi:MAG: hypothetical protein OXU73_01455 [Candidatus Campbellbacteria bacterium]|nr:hypothetical protein [Candidatus Campbellbacteria bacterium]